MKNQTSVTVSLPGGDPSQQITFHQSKAIGIPMLKGTSSDILEKVNQAHVKILQYEPQILAWVAASDQNAKLFAENPIEAMGSSAIGIPAEILAELKTVSQLLLTTLKK